MGNITTIENGIMYNGKKVTVVQKGNNFIINADGKKIKVDEERFVLIYTFFSMVYKSYAEDLKKEVAYS